MIHMKECTPSLALIGRLKTIKSTSQTHQSFMMLKTNNNWKTIKALGMRPSAFNCFLVFGNAIKHSPPSFQCYLKHENINVVV